MGLIFCIIPIFSQTTGEGVLPETVEVQSETEETASLTRSFRELALGMSLDELKNALSQDSLFHYRGDRDVSFLPIQEQTLIETTGFSFIRRAFFQLEEGMLFIMSFTLDPSLIDHYSVFTQFVEKYGEPNSLNPRQAVWENDVSRISLERPLTVKYIDKIVFDELIEQSNAEESYELELRRDFLNDF
jgi:hypothetical protein